MTKKGIKLLVAGGIACASVAMILKYISRRDRERELYKLDNCDTDFEDAFNDEQRACEAEGEALAAQQKDEEWVFKASASQLKDCETVDMFKFPLDADEFEFNSDTDEFGDSNEDWLDADTEVDI